MSGERFTLDPAAKDELINLLKALAACLAGNPGDYTNTTNTTLQGHVNTSGESLQAQIQERWKQLQSTSWFSALGDAQGMRAEFNTIVTKILPQWCTDGSAAIYQIISTIEDQSEQAQLLDSRQQWNRFHPN